MTEKMTLRVLQGKWGVDYFYRRIEQQGEDIGNHLFFFTTIGIVTTDPALNRKIAARVKRLAKITGLQVIEENGKIEGLADGVTGKAINPFYK